MKGLVSKIVFHIVLVQQVFVIEDMLCWRLRFKAVEFIVQIYL